MQRISVMFHKVYIQRPFVNLGIETSALELELELELIQQTPLFPVLLGLWTPNLTEW